MVLDANFSARYDTTDFTTTRFEPLSIADGGINGESDTLTVNSSNKLGFAAPIRINDYAGTDNQFTVSTILGAEPGDVMIVLPETVTGAVGECGVFAVTDSVAGGVRHDAGNDLPIKNWNHAPGFLPAYAEKSSVSQHGDLFVAHLRHHWQECVGREDAFRVGV